MFSFVSKVEAVKWATEAELEILGGRSLFTDKTFGDLMRKYRDEISPNKSPREVSRIDHMIQGWIADVKLQELTPQHFAKWRDERIKVVSGSTVDRDMATMSAAIKVGMTEWGWLNDSPIKGVARPQVNPARDRLISDEEIEMIVAASGYRRDRQPVTVSQRAGAAFLFAIETGMRNQEIATLTMDRVFLDKRFVHNP